MLVTTSIIKNGAVPALRAGAGAFQWWEGIKLPDLRATAPVDRREALLF